MKRLLHKRITRNGFTLAELLIVVAILAILVAVSIPIFTSKLDEAKKATDEANLRACKALVSNAILTGEYPSTSWFSNDYIATAAYDAQNGCLVTGSAVDDLEGYGQGSDATGYTNSNITAQKEQAEVKAMKNGYLFVTITKSSGEFIIMWVPKS